MNSTSFNGKDLEFHDITVHKADICIFLNYSFHLLHHSASFIISCYDIFYLYQKITAPCNISINCSALVLGYIIFLQERPQ